MCMCMRVTDSVCRRDPTFHVSLRTQKKNGINPSGRCGILLAKMRCGKRGMHSNSGGTRKIFLFGIFSPGIFKLKKKKIRHGMRSVYFKPRREQGISVVLLRPSVRRERSAFSPLKPLYKTEKCMAPVSVMSDWMVGVCHPASRLAPWWRDQAVHLLHQCLTWSSSTHYLWVIPLYSFSLSLAAAHSADKVLKSLHLGGREGKKSNQHCRINAILTFGVFWVFLKPARLKFPYHCSKPAPFTSGTAVKLKENPWPVRQKAWPLVAASLIIDTQFHHHSSEMDWGDPIPAGSKHLLVGVVSAWHCFF